MRLAMVGIILSTTAFSIASAPQGGPAHVLFDINATPDSERGSLPQSFLALDGYALFTARSPALGRELYRTDGTEAGTFLLRDVYPTIFSGVLDFPPVRVGNVAYFAAVDPDHGTELWTTDGTVAGTSLVKDIVPGRTAGVPAGSGTPMEGAAAGGLFYFLANDGSHGLELWRSDGTEGGTFLLQDICPGVCTPYLFPHYQELESRAVGDSLFFVAGNNLWKTDGSSGGTVLVTDPVGPVSSLLGVANGLLFFAADDGSLGEEVWRSDGTEGGTYVLININPTGGSFPGHAVTFDGWLYFTAYDDVFRTSLWRTDGVYADMIAAYAGGTIGVFGGKLYFIGFDFTHGNELWVTDGTPEGTGLVKDLTPGQNGYFPLSGFTLAGGTLYFVDGFGAIWKTDGTEAGTQPIGGEAITFSPTRLRAVGHRLYFERNDPAYGTEPWVTDGTASGTMLLKDVRPGTFSSVSSGPPAQLGAKVLFAAADGVAGYELWATDGTPAGTGLVADVNPLQRTATSNPVFGSRLGRQLMIFASDGIHGFEPWITDGTESGTHLLADIAPGPNASTFGGSAAWRGQVYFPADDLTHGREMWVTDGTAAGTRLVADVIPGPAGLGLGSITPLDAVMVFVGYDDEHGDEIWTSDGTGAGTRLLRDFNPGPAGSFPHALMRFGDAVYFFRYDATRVYMVRTDGTESGTLEIPLTPGFDVDLAVVFKDALWFVASDYSETTQLWRSDGTIAGTAPVATIDAYAGQQATVAGDTLYFEAYGGEGGNELWRSDGTAAGTYRLKDIRPGPVGSYPRDLVAVGQELFFAADDGTHGYEVWKSDGTEAGTTMVSDIEPGRFSSLPTNLRNVEGVVLFSAGLDAEGLELWRTDGTEAGTYLVQDLLPGAQYSSPRGFITFGSRVYFTALDDLAGREPWVARAAILTRQPVRAVQDLADDVRALGLPDGIENSLTAKLDAAARSLERPNGARTAQKQLAAFANEVRAKTPPITEAAAADLLEFVEEIDGLFGASVTLPRHPLREAEERRIFLDRPR
ncbi:MAG TPA: ELWxxDGT repeat protein [Candidatus Polarisedimenticolaceae bacterium]|nr:ELWxxDGT repeat protein [Candidatus Polarisedimenticolaceae bacterium]